MCENVIKKYKLLRIRMKIGFMAYTKNQTINELFLRTILDSYKLLSHRGILLNPYPRVNKRFLTNLFEGNSQRNVENEIEK